MSQSDDGRTSATARLLVLLQRLAAVSSDQALITACAEAYGAGRKDRGAAFRYLSETYRLISEAKAEVASHPDLNQDLYLSPVLEVEGALGGIQPGSPLKQILEPLQAGLKRLAFTADQMSRLSGEQALSDGFLQEVRERAEALLDEILDSDLDDNLKEVLQERLEDICTAVIDYHLYGAEVFEQAVDAGISLVVRRSDEVAGSRNSGQLKDYLELVVKIDAAVAAARRWTAIASPVVRAFLRSGLGVG